MVKTEYIETATPATQAGATCQRDEFIEKIMKGFTARSRVQIYFRDKFRP
tara:strand:+ start:158 stop:307 length:150 start_codon:yes stop_codon:yes gene_type:complete